MRYGELEKREYCLLLVPEDFAQTEVARGSLLVSFYVLFITWALLSFPQSRVNRGRLVMKAGELQTIRTIAAL